MNITKGLCVIISVVLTIVEVCIMVYVLPEKEVLIAIIAAIIVSGILWTPPLLFIILLTDKQASTLCCECEIYPEDEPPTDVEMQEAPKDIEI